MQRDPHQAFHQMHQVALQWLKDADPEQIAQNAGVSYDASAGVFRFPFLGQQIRVTYPAFQIIPSQNPWSSLLILHYLHLADGCPLSGREIPFSALKDGMVRGGGIDRKFENAIGRQKDLSEQMLRQACRQMGGRQIETNADIAFLIPFLPRFPVVIKVWFADEEFPASGRMLLDASADHYFTIEDAVTAAEILIERITVPESARTFSAHPASGQMPR